MRALNVLAWLLYLVTGDDDAIPGAQPASITHYGTEEVNHDGQRAAS